MKSQATTTIDVWTACYLRLDYGRFALEADRDRWNIKHKTASEKGDATPIPWIKERLVGMTDGQALDIACGRGRHSLMLAQAGFKVDALDISEVGLASFKHPAITKHCVDLDSYTIPAQTYDLILNTCFLDRRMWPHIVAALKPRGIFLAVIATRTNAHIKTSRFKLEPNQLREGFTALQILDYQECDGYAYLHARKYPN